MKSTIPLVRINSFFKTVLNTAIFLGGSSTALAAPVATPIDPHFGIPTLPINSAFGDVTTIYASAVLLAVALLVFCFACFDGFKRKTFLPIFVALSGIGCVIPETFVDIAAGCYWTVRQGDVVFRIMGRDMTWFPFVAWLAFGACLTYLAYAALLRGVKTKWLWLAFIVAGIIDIVFEEIMLNAGGLYVYYGHQPLILFTEFPLWWMFSNAAGLFLAAALAYRYRKHLEGWRGLAMFFITPTSWLSVFGFAAMPASIVINGNYSWLVTQAGGLLTAALSALAVAGTMHLVLQRDPFNFGELEHQRHNIVVKQS